MKHAGRSLEFVRMKRRSPERWDEKAPSSSFLPFFLFVLSDPEKVRQQIAEISSHSPPLHF